MKYVKQGKWLRCCALVLLLCAALSVCALAAEADWEDGVYVFQGTEFSAQVSGDLEGIFVRSVPEAKVGVLCWDSRQIRAGDVLPYIALEQLTFHSAAEEAQEVTIGYIPISEDKLGEEAELTLQIKGKSNQAPKAKDIRLETYKNIANSGKLEATDPEGESLTFTLVDKPKYGNVGLQEDGTFVYTPKSNKVGEDSFTYTATDGAGNTSKTAKVEITIKKPVEEATFADLAPEEQFTAFWLREQGVFSGEQILDQVCFCPYRQVTRGEFLVMAMKLADIDPEEEALSSGFVDQEQSPAWIQPYLTAAMRQGIVSGVPTEEGLCFMASQPITVEEASVMLCNALSLPQVQPTADLASAVPVWAQGSVAALSQAGITAAGGWDAVVTRQAAGEMLYSMSQINQAEE